MEGMIISDNFSTWEWSRVHSNPSCMHSDIKSDSLKGQFFFCKSSWKGEERWTSSEGEEKKQIKGPLRVRADSYGLQGGGFTAVLCLAVLRLHSSLSTGSPEPPPHFTVATQTYIQTWPIHTHMHTLTQALGTTLEAGAEKWAEKGFHSFWRWIIQPVINYNLASLRQGLGEFLCWSGSQLIVFFLPVEADVGAEPRPNRGTRCLHIYCGPLLAKLLHNMNGKSALCRLERGNENLTLISRKRRPLWLEIARVQGCATTLFIWMRISPTKTKIETENKRKSTFLSI